MKKVKVYIGHTSNAHRRIHNEYRANGGHLRPFFDHALDNGQVGKILMEIVAGVPSAHSTDVTIHL